MIFTQGFRYLHNVSDIHTTSLIFTQIIRYLHNVSGICPTFLISAQGNVSDIYTIFLIFSQHLRYLYNVSGIYTKFQIFTNPLYLYICTKFQDLWLKLNLFPAPLVGKNK